MIITLGLIVLVAALIVAVAGVLGNGGSAHAVSHFSVFGYHLTGSAGTLFLSGIVVGAAGLLGLRLLLASACRTSRRGSAACRGLRQPRRETAAASQERDDLIEQRDTARADTTASQPAGDRWSRLRDLRNRLAAGQPAAHSDAPASRPALIFPQALPTPTWLTSLPPLTRMRLRPRPPSRSRLAVRCPCAGYQLATCR